MASSTEPGTPSQERGHQGPDPSLCIAIKKDHSLCSSRAGDGFQTCGIKTHREQDPSQMEGLMGGMDDGTCIAVKKDGERCQNPAHEGFKTCGIPAHRQYEKQNRLSVAESQKPTSVGSPAAAFQAGAEAPGQENADQTQKSPQPQSLASGNDSRLPSQFPSHSTPNTRAQSPANVPGDNTAEGPGLEQPRNFGPLNPGRGRSPSLGPNLPPALSMGDWEFLRADIRGFLAAIASDNRESLRLDSEQLFTKASERMNADQQALIAPLLSTLSYFREEQDKKEQKMTKELDEFYRGIAALQQSFHALSLAQKDAHTTLQRDYKGLAQKVDMLLSRDQQVTRSMDESLRQHHSQMDVLIKSHSHTLSAAYERPHRGLGDGSKILEQKLDTVLRDNQHLGNQIDALVNSHSEALPAAHPAHHSMLEDVQKKLDDKMDAIIRYDRKLRDLIDGLRKMLPDTPLVAQQQSYKTLRDDHEKLEEKMNELFSNGQAIDRSLTEKFRDHNARFEATFKSNFDKLIASHQQTSTMLQNGQGRLEDKMNAGARDDHGRLATHVIDDLQNQRQAMSDEFTAMGAEFGNLETFIRHFCLQVQVALPGSEGAKDLRRRQADQYEYLEKLKNDFIRTYGLGKEAEEEVEEFIPASGPAQRESRVSSEL